MALLDSNFLQTLINSGPDAQSNLYEVAFTSSDSTSSDDVQSQLRCRVSNNTNIFYLFHNGTNGYQFLV